MQLLVLNGNKTYYICLQQLAILITRPIENIKRIKKHAFFLFTSGKIGKSQYACHGKFNIIPFNSRQMVLD